MMCIVQSSACIYLVTGAESCCHGDCTYDVHYSYIPYLVVLFNAWKGAFPLAKNSWKNEHFIANIQMWIFWLYFGCHGCWHFAQGSKFVVWSINFSFQYNSSIWFLVRFSTCISLITVSMQKNKNPLPNII